METWVASAFVLSSCLVALHACGSSTDPAQTLRGGSEPMVQQPSAPAPSLSAPMTPASTATHPAVTPTEVIGDASEAPPAPAGTPDGPLVATRELCTGRSFRLQLEPEAPQVRFEVLAAEAGTPFLIETAFDENYQALWNRLGLLLAAGPEESPWLEMTSTTPFDQSIVASVVNDDRVVVAAGNAFSGSHIVELRPGEMADLWFSTEVAIFALGRLADGRLIAGGCADDCYRAVMLEQDSAGNWDETSLRGGYDVHVIWGDAKEGLTVAGWPGFIARYKDGRWLQLSSPVDGRFFAIWPRGDDLWVGGSEGIVSITPDGSSRLIAMGRSAAWYSVQSWSDGAAIVVGAETESGGLVKPLAFVIDVNGEISWLPELPGSGANSVWAPDDDRCDVWVATDTGLYRLMPE